MKKIFMFTLILSLILCSFLGTMEKSHEQVSGLDLSGTHSNVTAGQDLPYSQTAWLTPGDDVIPEAICRERISVSEVFTRAFSNLSWLGILIRLIHIILFVCAAVVVRRISYTNTSRRFIIRYIHDKDGHKRLNFAF
ncbi:hypothetical protein [Agathobacter sp.]